MGTLLLKPSNHILSTSEEGLVANMAKKQDNHNRTSHSAFVS